MEKEYHLTESIRLSSKKGGLYLIKADKKLGRDINTILIGIDRVPGLIDWLIQLTGKPGRNEMAEALNDAVNVFGVNIVQQWLDQKKEESK